MTLLFLLFHLQARIRASRSKYKFSEIVQMEQNFVSPQRQFAKRRRFAAKSPLTLFVKNPDASEPQVGTVLPQTIVGANG
jgi:hypothetical protein